MIGVIGFFTIDRVVPAHKPLWIARLCTAVFALLWGAPLPSVIGRIVSPRRVRHAAPNVLPGVPREPVVLEGSVVHGRVTHELVEDPDSWHFRPAMRQWTNDKRFLLGFGIPFSIFFAGVLSWALRREDGVGTWPLAIVCGIGATLGSGGPAFVAIGMMMRAGYRRLCCLSIPRNGDALELDAPAEIDPAKADQTAGFKWVFHGECVRQRLTIPRDLLRAVQLCPWKHVVRSSSVVWAVQGLLIVASPSEGEYRRLPILLSSDVGGAAGLMQQLAATLGVPFLFCADAAGFEAERIRAQDRRPLRAGGSQS
jgi:hypothetical protein